MTLYNSPDHEPVGSVYVDAGLIFVGDPCYTLGTDSSNQVGTWDDFCKRLDFSTDVQEPIAKGIGIVVQSGYGDGEYPVFVTRKDGRVASVTVEFIGDHDDQDDDYGWDDFEASADDDE